MTYPDDTQSRRANGYDLTMETGGKPERNRTDVGRAAAGSPDKAFPTVPTSEYARDYTNTMMPKWTALPQNSAFLPSALNPCIEPAPKIELIHAIMDEARLPEPPSALIEGVLRQGGKMLLSGAAKTWKTFLGIQLGVCIATGMKWLGLPCSQGSVLYANLEVSETQFLKRVYDVAHSMEADPELVERNFRIMRRPNTNPTITQFVDAILNEAEARECSLVIIDPLYKMFKGSENEQRDMAAFFSEVDRLITNLNCATAVVHHQSKGYQGNKDAADRYCGSSVIARDMDTIVDVLRTNGKGKTMRAEFILRDFEGLEPIDYWFEYPICVPDENGSLARCRPTLAHGSTGGTPKTDGRLSEIEDACEKLIEGRQRFNRKELANATHIRKGETLNSYLDKSTRFTYESESNRCWVMRREAAA